MSFKITKKLAGHGKGTALWVSSIGNEVGQILVSVLAVQEGRDWTGWPVESWSVTAVQLFFPLCCSMWTVAAV